MCDICVINSVKERMLSRRDFFKTSAAVGAAATIGAVASAPRRSRRAMAGSSI